MTDSEQKINNDLKLPAEELAKAREEILKLIEKGEGTALPEKKKEILSKIIAKPVIAEENASADSTSSRQASSPKQSSGQAARGASAGSTSSRQASSARPELETKTKTKQVEKKVTAQDIKNFKNRLKKIEKEKISQEEQKKESALIKIINEHNLQKEIIKTNQEKLEELRQRLKEDEHQRRKKIKLVTKKTLSSDLVLFILVFAVAFLALLILVIKTNY